MTDENLADTTANDDISSNEQVDSTATQETEKVELSPEQQAEAEAKAEEEKQAKESRTQKRRRQREKRDVRLAKEATHEAEKEAAYWKGKAEAGGSTSEAEVDAKPQQDDFETYGEFNEALVDWKLAQADKGKEKPPAKGEASGSHANNDNAADDSEEFKAFRAAGAEAYPDDIDDMIEVITGKDFPMSQAMAETITGEDVGLEMAMHFYDNPEEAAKIAKLTPLKQLNALNELGETLAKAEKKPDKKISGAPDPITPEKGSSVQNVAMSKLSTAD